MKIKLTDLIDRAKNPRDKNLRRHLYIFLICCVISLFIWFLIKMSDEYVSEVKMPVTYLNAPENKLLLEADNFVYVRLRAKGGDIFSSRFFTNYLPLNINLNQAEIRKSRYFDKYYILTNQFRNQFSSRFDFAHSVLGVHPDTLYLNFEEVITRILPIKARVTLNCMPQFQVYDSVQILPAEMKISGPASVLDTMTYINTEQKDFSNLNKNLETTLLLSSDLRNNKIRLERSEVNLKARIEEFTESVIELPVSGQTSEPEATLKTFPETVELTYTVALKDYRFVKGEMFTLSVSYDETTDKGKNFLKIKVENKPDFVNISRINPEKVEFLIQK